jgi:hypothetical protein
MNRTATIVLAGLLLLAGSALGSYAANGGPLLLGESNTSSKTTALKTTGKGAALKLRTKPGKPPLKVTSTGRVKKLNADLVDGLDGATLRNTAYHYQLAATSGSNLISFTPTGLPPGRYHAAYAVTAVTTGAATGLLCQFLGTAESTTIPADPSGDAQLVLTRLDDITTSNVAGVGGP